MKTLRLVSPSIDDDIEKMRGALFSLTSKTDGGGYEYLSPHHGGIILEAETLDGSSSKLWEWPAFWEEFFGHGDGFKVDVARSMAKTLLDACQTADDLWGDDDLTQESWTKFWCELIPKLSDLKPGYENGE